MRCEPDAFLTLSAGWLLHHLKGEDQALSGYRAPGCSGGHHRNLGGCIRHGQKTVCTATGKASGDRPAAKDQQSELPEPLRFSLAREECQPGQAAWPPE